MQNGARIAEARKNSGLTQKQLAEQIPCDVRQVQKWESNTTTAMKTDNLKKLCQICNVSADYILDLSDKKIGELK